ncbi:MAG: sel1 repeat family protein [Succinivibrio sp.]|nr:sel1 repeat family protein [Succinivibrio sp.]
MKFKNILRSVLIVTSFGVVIASVYLTYNNSEEAICRQTMHGKVSYDSFEACAIEADKGAKYARDFLERILENKARGMQNKVAKAFAWFNQLKDPDVEYRLGMLYLRGRGVPKDSALALKYLNYSISHGYDKAVLGLGFAYDSGFKAEGFGDLQDFSKARELYNNVIDTDCKNNSKEISETAKYAMYNLALLDAKGFGLANKDEQSAKLKLEKLAANQFPLAKVALDSDLNSLCPLIGNWTLFECAVSPNNK